MRGVENKCPFCGEPVDLVSFGNISNYKTTNLCVICRNCGCEITIDTSPFPYNGLSAFDIWNRRADNA